jgi:hypothetical protein
MTDKDELTYEKAAALANRVRPARVISLAERGIRRGESTVPDEQVVPLTGNASRTTRKPRHSRADKAKARQDRLSADEAVAA